MKTHSTFIWLKLFLAWSLAVALLPLAPQRAIALGHVRQAGTLTVLTDNNAHCFYTYHEKPMGFEYDLVKAFADYLGVGLKVVSPGWERLFDALQNGEGDFIAASLTPTPLRRKIVDFSDGYLPIQQHVITHKDNLGIRSLRDLEGKTIHVRKGTSHQERLEELQQEGLHFDLVITEDTPTEELIRQVAEGEIDVTVAPSNVALLNRRYYPDISIGIAVEEEQTLGWAVRKGDRKLLEQINRFFNAIEENGTFGKIYNRYYENVEIFDFVDIKKFHIRLQTRLPKYAETIRQEAARYSFDWILIAALVYRESHFDPRAISHTGVKGLMQLTLATAQEVGIQDRLDPVQSIVGGVKYLHTLYKRFEDIHRPDRMLFALASYNVGYGHVRDAQQIARRLGMDPKRWSSLKNVLPLLRYRQYHEHTTHGYARGTEPVQFVESIFLYYDILKRVLLQQERGGALSS